MSRTFDLTETIAKILDEYGSEVKGVLDKEIPLVAQAARRKVSQESPESSKDATGEYAKDWKAKVDENTRVGISAVVFNKSHYQLTHLLEDGHVNWVKGRRDGSPKARDAEFSHKISNGIRTDGLPGSPHPFMEEHKHIGPVADWASDELYERVVKDLERL